MANARFGRVGGGADLGAVGIPEGGHTVSDIILAFAVGYVSGGIVAGLAAWQLHKMWRDAGK